MLVLVSSASLEEGKLMPARRATRGRANREGKRGIWAMCALQICAGATGAAPRM